MYGIMLLNFVLILVKRYFTLWNKYISEKKGGYFPQ